MTREELEEAQRALQDFLEGMGASGVADRPEDMDLPKGRLSYEEAQELLGMTGWRLGAKVGRGAGLPDRLTGWPSLPAACVCWPTTLSPPATPKHALR